MSAMEYNVNAVWKIKKETVLNLKEYRRPGDEEIVSEKFETTLPNIQYIFTLCWNDENIEIYFIPLDGTADACDKILVKKLELIIPSEKLQIDFDVSEENWAQITFIKREELLNSDSKYFDNDILTLEIRGTLFYKAPIISLLEMLWKKEDKDFTFIIGNGTIKAHKFILRQYSSILAADMNSNEIKIENFDYSIVRAVVELCYELKPRIARLSPWISYKIIEFCNVYDMPLIKEQVEHTMSDKITAKNVCSLANVSLELNANILRSFCVNFLSDCIKCQKTFDGTLTDLKQEIVAEVFRKSFRQTHTS